MPSCIRSSRRNRRRPNRRMESVGPSIVTGGRVALTRLPSGSRASTMGDAFVDPPAHPGGDPLDDPHQVLGVAEAHVGLLQPTEPLDVDLPRPVDEDVGDRRIGHQRRPAARRRASPPAGRRPGGGARLRSAAGLRPPGLHRRKFPRSRSSVSSLAPRRLRRSSSSKSRWCKTPLTEIMLRAAADRQRRRARRPRPCGLGRASSPLGPAPPAS